MDDYLLPPTLAEVPEDLQEILITVYDYTPMLEEVRLLLGIDSEVFRDRAYQAQLCDILLLEFDEDEYTVYVHADRDDLIAFIGRLH